MAKRKVKKAQTEIHMRETSATECLSHFFTSLPVTHACKIASPCSCKQIIAPNGIIKVKKEKHDPQTPQMMSR